MPGRPRILRRAGPRPPTRRECTRGPRPLRIPPRRRRRRSRDPRRSAGSGTADRPWRRASDHVRIAGSGPTGATCPCRTQQPRPSGSPSLLRPDSRHAAPRSDSDHGVDSHPDASGREPSQPGASPCGQRLPESPSVRDARSGGRLARLPLRLGIPFQHRNTLPTDHTSHDSCEVFTVLRGLFNVIGPSEPKLVGQKGVVTNEFAVATDKSAHG